MLSKERVVFLDLTVGLHLWLVTSLITVEPVSDCFQNFEHVQNRHTHIFNPVIAQERYDRA